MLTRFGIVGSIVASLLFVLVPSAAAPTTQQTFTVSATSANWLDTGIALGAGKTVQLAVSGDGTCHAGGSSDCPVGDPSGSGKRCSAAGGNGDQSYPPGPAGDAVPYGAVAGRLLAIKPGGPRGETKPFLVGAGKSVHGPGRLQLAYNDCLPPAGYSDNAGSFEVTAIQLDLEVAMVVEIKGGQAYVRRGGKGPLVRLVEGDRLEIGDTVLTGAETSLALEFAIGGRVGASENTRLIVIGERDVVRGGPKLKIGIWARSTRLQQPLEIQTKGGVTGIKG